MSAPSDGARADARKARAEAYHIATGQDLPARKSYIDLADLIADDTDEPMWSAVVIAKHILASDWLAGVIADAKAEVREQIAMEIEAKAAGNHAAFAADEDEHLIRLGERYAGEWKPTYANRHDDGCGMCGLASAARIARGDS